MKNRKGDPQPDWSWEVLAVIAKADIAPVHALIGKVNASDITIEATRHPAGRVVFKGFAGARCDDGMYHGVYRFAVAETNRECDTFASLPGWDNADASPTEPAAASVCALDADMELQETEE